MPPVASPERERPAGWRKCKKAIDGLAVVKVPEGTATNGTGLDLLVQREAAAQALDYIQRGFLVTDAASHVLFSNRKAESILRFRDGLYLRPDGLGATRPRDTVELRAAIRRAANPDESSSVAVMSLWRPSLKRMLLLRISSLQGAMLPFAPALHRAAVFLHDPEEPAVINASILSRLYGLTRAETHLVELLLNGSTLPQAAEAVHVSLSTARTHLKHVFMKTDTNRQTQLVKLLLGSVVQIPEMS